jgi:hypothetical protein
MRPPRSPRCRGAWVLALLSGATLLGAGCAIPPKSVRAYEGAEHLDSELAIVRAHYDDSMYGKHVTIHRVDGKSAGWFVSEVRLLPGPHVLDIGFSETDFGGSRASTDPLSVTLTAESGHVYLVDVGYVREGGLGEKVFGPSKWTTWIRDESTQQIVAGTPPHQ